MDIQGYFMSIDRFLLDEMLKTEILKNSLKIKGDIDTLLFVIRKTIFNEPVNDCIFRSKKNEWVGLPPSKSLFHAGQNKGLPIGNLTSQLFANIYLDGFDHFMKRDMKLKYYGRYVDDIVVIHPDQQYLKIVIPAARAYLEDRLMLRLHPRKIYLQHFTKGVIFLGAIIKPYRIYIAKHTKGNFYQAVYKYNRLAEESPPTPDLKEKFVCSMNSYLGIMKHYRTAKLREHIIKDVVSPAWWKHFYALGRYRIIVQRKRQILHFVRNDKNLFLNTMHSLAAARYNHTGKDLTTSLNHTKTTLPGTVLKNPLKLPLNKTARGQEF